MSDRYPEHVLPIARELPETYARFADLREEFLVGHGYHTARAYWGDLQDLFAWTAERDKDILQLTQRDFTQYMALLRRRGYRESTIRRRITAARGLYQLLGENVAEPQYQPPRRR